MESDRERERVRERVREQGRETKTEISAQEKPLALVKSAKSEGCRAALS